MSQSLISCDPSFNDPLCRPSPPGGQAMSPPRRVEKTDYAMALAYWTRKQVTSQSVSSLFVIIAEKIDRDGSVDREWIVCGDCDRMPLIWRQCRERWRLIKSKMSLSAYLCQRVGVLAYRQIWQMWHSLWLCSSQSGSMAFHNCCWRYLQIGSLLGINPFQIPRP